MVNCEPTGDIYNDSGELLARLAKMAENGAESFRVMPTYPLYLAGEPWEFQVEWQRRRPAAHLQLKVEVERSGAVESQNTFELAGNSSPAVDRVTIAPRPETGLRSVTAHLICDGEECGIYRTGFWIRDRRYLTTGSRVTVDKNFFQVNGRQLPVVGTTYMASDVQRLYFRYPNPYLWDRDMEQISADGLNMLRTGWWTDWDALTGNSGVATERTVRTVEAYLMTARKHDLPVQWNFFAFMPDAFGGGNPYLGSEALRREQAFIASVVTPFKDVPFLMWDLINEPSFDNPKRFWVTRANGDGEEIRQWNQWLLKRYGSREEIESAWQTVLDPGDVPTPVERDFSAQEANQGARSLMAYDFNRFAQEEFAEWAQAMRGTIRATGSNQLITVGQDEGGVIASPSPAFFRSAVDFTTVHTWWLYDGLLWDSLAAKQNGLPMLVQETGVLNEFDADGRSRRTPEGDAKLVERKIGIALGTGAGAIEWLWNINAMMRSQQEVTIGVIRPDGTERPEAQVLQAYARFAAAARDHFQNPVTPEVTILTSQALQYSTMNDMAVNVQNRAVRTMSYLCHTPTRVITENHADEISGSKLVILPSPQALLESTWITLLAYVEGGGKLLITGPLERDEHWKRTERLRGIGVNATVSSLTFHGVPLEIDGENVEVSFAQSVQQKSEVLTLPDNSSYLEVTRGKGTIYLVAYPVELAESPEAAYEVYQHVLSRAGIERPFTGQPVSPSVLIRPVEFSDSILYLFASESARDEAIDIRDRATGAGLKFLLLAGRTRLMLLRKSDGKVLESYDPPELR
jgi:hypothetical protein